MRHTVPLILGAALIGACGGSSDTPEDKASFAPMVRPADLATLTGDDWEGRLTYLNHAEPQKEVTVPAELAVAQNGNTFELYFTYPEKPDASGRAELTISENGRMINEETVVAREESGETLTVETKQKTCQDNGEPAACRYIYEIAPDDVSITKMVTPDGADEAFRRNHYTFSRERQSP